MQMSYSFMYQLNAFTHDTFKFKSFAGNMINLCFFFSYNISWYEMLNSFKIFNQFFKNSLVENMNLSKLQ